MRNRTFATWMVRHIVLWYVLIAALWLVVLAGSIVAVAGGDTGPNGGTVFMLVLSAMLVMIFGGLSIAFALYRRRAAAGAVGGGSGGAASGSSPAGLGPEDAGAGSGGR